LTVSWGAPQYIGGCPLQNFNLFINNGNNDAATNLAGSFEPSTNEFTVTGFTNTQTSK